MISQDQETRTQIRKAVSETIEIIIRNNLSKQELLIEFLGRLTLSLGCSILGLEEKEVDRNKIRKMYALEPTLGSAIACIGIDILDDWISKEEKLPELKNSKDNVISSD